MHAVVESSVVFPAPFDNRSTPGLTSTVAAMVGLPITGVAGRNNRIATHPTPASVTPRPIRRTGRPRDTTGPPRRVPRGLVITTRRGERTLRSGVTAVTGAGVTGRVRGPDTRPRTARARELRPVPDRIAP